VTEKNRPAPDTTGREIATTRIFNAPREMLWCAMTNPLHLVNWWGPHGFTTTVEEMDVRPGGAWNLTMHGPDGAEYPNRSVFTEVVEPEKIVFVHGGARKGGGPDANFVGTWLFEKIDEERTRVTVRMVFETPEERDLVAKEYGAVEGLGQTLSRLEEGLQSSDHLIARVFDAPRARLWKMFTDPVHLARWWGPCKLETIIEQLDPRVGGRYKFVMQAPDGTRYPMKGVYREVVEPEKLVYSVDVSEHPPEWHAAILKNLPPGTARDSVGELSTTIIFTELGTRTRVTIRSTFESSALRNAFTRIGMTKGWSQSLDKLAEQLAKGGTGA
jgi:uncharacterized protein YndB with AHSA1/START domain